ncbi:MAG: argininosuccinate lyase [Pseudomonadota bacterium]|nr:argininosuccinate lyase [Pseudomonadota bacterium]
MAKKSNKPAAQGGGPGTKGIRGGRFKAGPADVMQEINSSIDFDRHLYAQDITGSKAHAAMLVNAGIISQEDGDAIIKGLDSIAEEIESGNFEFSQALEDIHMNVESRLGDLIGDAARRLPTARSRNDQVATDFRLWVRDTLDGLDAEIRNLQAALIDRAEEHAAAVMPGLTHLQGAQPVTLGHHLLAYVEMLGRDRSRAKDCRRRLNECPLGSAALAGTSFPIDREQTASALGFDKPMANSMDGVSDRDFALEYLSLAAILAVHLSRLAEEIVLWCSRPFAYVRMPDAFSTGSSIMPQKRNPDAAELVRAKAGGVIGALGALLVVMKGLPLAYGKDLQEDKAPVFETAATLSLSLAAMAGMVSGMEFDTGRMKADAGGGFATATDLADWLVRELEMPFRDAHRVTGRLVGLAEEKGLSLDGLSLDDMQSVEKGITEAVLEVLGVDNSVTSRDSFGGTAPERVRQAVSAARKRFLN